MADDPHNTSDLSDPIVAGSPKEDAETKTTREELKQTTISERVNTAGHPDDEARIKTPELNAPSTDKEYLKDQASSPKKKRGHDELDAQRDVEGADAISSTTDSERDKKRARDGEAASDDGNKTDIALAADKTKDTTSQSTAAAAASPKKDAAAPSSSSTFAGSGFSKLTGTASPFGALGGSSKPSVFGGAASGSSASPFGSLGGAAAAAKPATPSLSFGSQPGAASPFASANGPSKSSFGSAFGSGFGGAIAGAKLSSFAKPGEVFKSDRPAKPFGAPDSDAEEDEESGPESDEDKEAAAEEAEAESEEKAKETEEPKAAADDKRKKLHKVSVDDGEAGEATIFAARAKLFVMDKELGWKERGAGILKVNVPETTVDFDDAGAPVPASFDASVLDEEDDEEESGGSPKSKLVRLILRQDHTHRVILNTVVVPATNFQKRAKLNNAYVLFLAFEGADAKPTSMQMKMSLANTDNFLSLMVGIQKELRGD